jgi:UPF0716 family protein affecting phage T7 exclusion
MTAGAAALLLLLPGLTFSKVDWLITFPCFKGMVLQLLQTVTSFRHAKMQHLINDKQ